MGSLSAPGKIGCKSQKPQKTSWSTGQRGLVLDLAGDLKVSDERLGEGSKESKRKRKRKEDETKRKIGKEEEERNM